MDANVVSPVLRDLQVDLEAFEAGVTYQKIRQEVRLAREFVSAEGLELTTVISPNLIPLVTHFLTHEGWKVEFKESDVDEFDFHSVIISSW